jgi:exonuclease VII large subunit
MPREPDRDLRQDAERKVEQRFAQQREALFALQREQYERDRRSQEQAVERIARQQTQITEQKRETLAQHERKWDQMRDRIAYKPEPAPSPFGWTPPRDLNREYKEMRRQWLDQRETIEQATTSASRSARQRKMICASLSMPPTRFRRRRIAAITKP